MTSINKDAASFGKIKCLDFVETVSDALMKILKNSSNEEFLVKCLSNLQVSTAVQAERRLKFQLWKLLDNDDGPESKNSLHKTTSAYLERQAIVHTEQPQTHDYNASLPLINNNHAASDFTNSNSHLLYFERCSIGTLQKHHTTQDVSCNQNEPLYNDDIVSYNYNTSYSTQLTSTPVEYSQHSQPLSENQLDSLIADLDDEFDSDVEVLRDTRCEDDFNQDGLSEDFEYSWESLKLSDIQNISRPTATDPSIHFSNPDILSESYLLRDVPDFAGTMLELNDEVDDKIPFIGSDTSVTAIDSNVDSENLVTRALSIIRDSIIVDFEFQENEEPTSFIEESCEVNIQERIAGENTQEGIALAHIEDNEIVEAYDNHINNSNFSNNHTRSIVSPARSDCNVERITGEFTQKDIVLATRNEIIDTYDNHINNGKFLNKLAENISSPSRSDCNANNDDDILVLFEVGKNMRIQSLKVVDSADSNSYELSKNFSLNVSTGNNFASSLISQSDRANKNITQNDSNFYKEQTADKKDTTESLQSDFNDIDDTEGSYECFFDSRKEQDKLIDTESASSTDTDVEMLSENDVKKKRNEKSHPTKTTFEKVYQLELDENDFIW